MRRRKAFERRGVSDHGLFYEQGEGGKKDMGKKKVKIFYDPIGNTMSVWFDDPKKEHICEETGAEVILVKDKKGKVIVFEKLNFLPKGFPVNRKSFPIKTEILQTNAV